MPEFALVSPMLGGLVGRKSARCQFMHDLINQDATGIRLRQIQGTSPELAMAMRHRKPPLAVDDSVFLGIWLPTYRKRWRISLAKMEAASSFNASSFEEAARAERVRLDQVRSLIRYVFRKGTRLPAGLRVCDSLRPNGELRFSIQGRTGLERLPTPACFFRNSGGELVEDWRAMSAAWEVGNEA